jgi:hypothetical protein
MENYGMKQAQRKEDKMYLTISFLPLNFYKMKRSLQTAITLRLMVDLMEAQSLLRVLIKGLNYSLQLCQKCQLQICLDTRNLQLDLHGSMSTDQVMSKVPMII